MPGRLTLAGTHPARREPLARPIAFAEVATSARASALATRRSWDPWTSVQSLSPEGLARWPWPGLETRSGPRCERVPLGVLD
jgi:hypothetical protein